MKRLTVLLLSLALGCGDDVAPADAAIVDAGAEPDAGTSMGDGGARLDAGASDAGDLDAGVPSGTQVAAFVLQGHMGRVALSCDDGRTWVADHSADAEVRCWGDGGPDCDHDANAGRGLLHVGNWLYRTLGWGPPGGVERSQDGVNWERTLDETTFAGLASDGEVIVTGARHPRRSLDEGASWLEVGDVGFSEWNVRSVGWAPYEGGRFFLIADGPEMMLSTDQGASWRAPTTPPSACSGMIAHGGGTIVTANTDGLVCSSTDGGESWTETTVADSLSGRVVFRDGTFFVWGRGRVYTSPDARTWTGQDTTPANLVLGVVAVNPTTGTFAAVEGGWTQWYEDQSAYRSTDGVTWETLDAAAFTGGHPARDLVFGYVSPSAAGCPAE